MKPLLDALADDRDSQQRTAVELLSHVSNAKRRAGALRLRDGEGRWRAPDARDARRRRARRPCDPAATRSTSSSPHGNVRVDETDTVAIAAAWARRALRSPQGDGRCSCEMLSSDAPSVARLAAMGLGLLGNRGERALALAGIAGSPERGARRARRGRVRARRARRRVAPKDVLARLVEASDPLVCATAVRRASRACGANAARRVIATGLVATESSAARCRADVRGSSSSTREWRAHARGRSACRAGRSRRRARRARLACVPPGISADERARAVLELADELAKAPRSARASPGPTARASSPMRCSRGADEPAFAPLTNGIDDASRSPRALRRSALERIGRALVGPFLALLEASVRRRCGRGRSRARDRARTEAAGRRRGGAARSGARRAARRAHRPSSASDDRSALDAVTRLSEKADAWAVRARADGSARRRSSTGLARAAAVAVARAVAERDPVAFVRETAVRALGGASGESHAALLRRVSTGSRAPRPRPGGGRSRALRPRGTRRTASPEIAWQSQRLRRPAFERVADARLERSRGGYEQSQSRLRIAAAGTNKIRLASAPACSLSARCSCSDARASNRFDTKGATAYCGPMVIGSLRPDGSAPRAASIATSGLHLQLDTRQSHDHPVRLHVGDDSTTANRARPLRTAASTT